jgi:hypothetical protein
VFDGPKRATFEQLLDGKVSQVSLINEPVTAEPARESATARAMRRWWPKLERSDDQ